MVIRDYISKSLKTELDNARKELQLKYAQMGIKRKVNKKEASDYLACKLSKIGLPKPKKKKYLEIDPRRFKKL